MVGKRVSMPGLLPDVDPTGLLEYSVVYSDRSLNHMSQSFRTVMTDISSTLRKVYAAEAVAIVPGSGTFGMEAVARQFAADQHCLVIRNGWFSYRWSQILDMGSIPKSTTVLKARPNEDGDCPGWAPVPLEEAKTAIEKERPGLVFAPHVETASGMILPDDYIKGLAEAVHSVGGMLVLDCIASGALWIDMKAMGVDVLISAPQKGWSGSPCCALVMLGATAKEKIESTTSSSFACDLKKWLQIMEAYEGGGHAYHATMPTDALRTFHKVMKETEEIGFDKVREQQAELGAGVRSLLASKGLKSVAAEGFGAPGVVVSYTEDAGMHTGKKFAEAGIQIAAGVPLKCDEPASYKTFRIGLFGLDKLQNVAGTIQRLEDVLQDIR